MNRPVVRLLRPCSSAHGHVQLTCTDRLLCAMKQLLFYFPFVVIVL
uniref:Predicted protein n=1 Tax=Hordeum vulgare subsp. vulgare TaxID=112509 RepID=F2E4S8_HORVV|nr:predicted protein [Hordeum vulgare subsp. vulgare]